MPHFISFTDQSRKEALYINLDNICQIKFREHGAAEITYTSSLVSNESTKELNPANYASKLRDHIDALNK